LRFPESTAALFKLNGLFLKHHLLVGLFYLPSCSFFVVVSSLARNASSALCILINSGAHTGHEALFPILLSQHGLEISWAVKETCCIFCMLAISFFATAKGHLKIFYFMNRLLVHNTHQGHQDQ
jgi:hypothetical protein